MKKAIGVFFFIFFSFTVVLAQQTVITGQLLGSDGKPMIKGEVVLLNQKVSGKPLTFVEVKKDGSYEVTIDKIGVFFLRFVGVNHRYRHVPLVLEGDTNNVKLNVQLQANQYRSDDKLLKLSIRGQNPIDFQKQEDGTYLAEVKTDKERLEYQVFGLEPNGMFLPGTQSEDYVYDNTLSYRSVVTSKDGKAKIILDRKKLISSDAKPKIDVETKNSHIKEIIKIYADLEEQQIAHNSFMATHNYEPTEEELKAYNQQKTQIDTEKAKAIKMRLTEEKEPFIRQILLANYFAYSSLKPEPEIVKMAVNEILPNSLVWSVVISWSKNFFKACEADQRETYLNRFLSENKDVDAKANILLNLLLDAISNKNEEAKNKYYDILTKDYSSTNAMRTALTLPGVGRVKTGTKVPEFSVTSLDDKDKVISNTSLKGKYYLIDFWATWCIPCVGEMDNLHKAYEKFKGKNFEILSLSFDENLEAITKFRQNKWKMPWLNTFVEKAFFSDLATRFEISGIPKPILIDPEGKILAIGDKLRGEGLDKTLTETLDKAQ